MTTTELEPNWEYLLIEAVTKPGKVLAAYSLFHNYSLGNALLTLIQREMRGIRPGPITTFPSGRHQGATSGRDTRPSALYTPITCKKPDQENQEEDDSRN